MTLPYATMIKRAMIYEGPARTSIATILEQNRRHFPDGQIQNLRSKTAKLLASRLWVNSHTKNGRHIQTQSPCVRWSIRKLKRLVNTLEGSTDLPSGKRLAEAQPQGLAGATPPLPLGTGPL